MKPTPATVYDELTAETSPGRNKLRTWLDKAGAPEMPRADAERIIAFALLSWEQLAALRELDKLPPAVMQAHPSEPANRLEIVMHTLAKWKDSAAYLVPKIRAYWQGRDALQIRLSTRPKSDFESDYDIQAEVRDKLPGLTDENVTKRRQRLERSQRRNAQN